jgi:uncharacterized protein
MKSLLALRTVALRTLAIVTLLATAAVPFVLVARSFGQQIQVSKDNRTVAVTAQGEATQMADAATVHVGYLVYGPDSPAAYAAASKASNDIAAALAAAGVPKDAIQSEDQSIAPVEPFELKDLPPALVAQRQFKVQQSWSVKTTAAKAAEVLDAAVKAGANSGGQIDWTVADPEVLHAKAMQNALSHAQVQASTIAVGLSAKLGSLIYASNEPPQHGPVPLQLNRMQTMAAAPMEKVKPLSVNARRISDSATIYAVFAIE